MSLTNLQKLRLTILDGAKVKAEEIVGLGDEVRTIWVLERSPIKAGSAIITVNGVTKTLGTDHTLDLDTGLLTFLAGQTPRAEQVIKATYSFYAFSDDELNSILDDENNVILMAAAQCLRTLATDAARFFIFTSGDEKVDKSKISSNFLRVADKLEARAKAIPASAAEHWKVELDEFGDIAQELDLTKYLET